MIVFPRSMETVGENPGQQCWGVKYCLPCGTLHRIPIRMPARWERAPKDCAQGKCTVAADVSPWERDARGNARSIPAAQKLRKEGKQSAGKRKWAMWPSNVLTEQNGALVTKPQRGQKETRLPRKQLLLVQKSWSWRKLSRRTLFRWKNVSWEHVSDKHIRKATTRIRAPLSTRDTAPVKNV